MTDFGIVPIDDGAHCRQPGVDPEWFFPRPGAIDSSTAAQAKRICNDWPSGEPCPFRAPCREYGIRNAVHGIWGGLSENDRKAERKRRGIVPQPVSSGAVYPQRFVS
jgi:hypothetical protein